MTNTATTQVHEFRVSGCANQFHGDHDHSDCWAAFLKFHHAPAGLSISEFYDGLDNGGWK